MLTAIGITLIFAGATSALGVPRALRVYRRTGSLLHGLLPAAIASAMALWFVGAGLWALSARWA